jgi:hypothetical protein
VFYERGAPVSGPHYVHHSSKALCSYQHGRHVQGYLTYVGKRFPLEPYSRTMPRVLGGSHGGGRFLMSEEPCKSLLESHLFIPARHVCIPTEVMSL